jgi:asparagine synthetase B (glutamine-hydrolysing)
MVATGALSDGPVRRMMAAMSHRGPDDEGYESFALTDDAQGPSVSFGFRRLAIVLVLVLE